MMPDFHQEGQPQVKEWAPEQQAPVILIENVSKTYGKIHALSGITLALSGGVTGILGMNGAGKSTLFKILMGKLNQVLAKYVCWYQSLEEPSTIFTCWFCS